LLEERDQAVEARAPEAVMPFHPRHRPGERAAREVESVHAPVAFANEQSCLLQHAQVPRDGRCGEPERLRQLADARLAAREPLQHAAAHGVGEGREHGVEVGLGILNHVVNY